MRTRLGAVVFLSCLASGVAVRADDIERATLALAGWPFATERSGSVNNVALQWATTTPCDSYELQRAAGMGESFATIYSGRGASFQDENLAPGSYSYRLLARRGSETLTSKTVRVSNVKLSRNAREYSNQTGAGRDALDAPLKVGKTFYRFPGTRDGKTVTFRVQTSADGKTWKGGPVVLDATSHPDLADFKFEAESFFYDKRRNKIVLWCHWERASGYNDGKAFVATATPGERFVVHRIYNPLGVQVRDMSVFRDSDGKGYLIAASNVAGQGANATLTLFSMNDDYTDVTGIVSRAMENGYREAPHIVRHDGYYYLFFSQAAGWYPSRAGYVSSRSLAGPWSAPRTLGNTSTFSAQSGGLRESGQSPIMMANRWIRAESTSPNAAFPLHLSEGFVFGDYAPSLLLAKDRVVPLQMGQLLSQDRPATASISGTEGHDAGKAFDGDYDTAFQSDDKTWPFTVATDLGAPCALANIQISWHLHKGSEAFYKYAIEGSLDGKTWRVLLDRTDEKDPHVSRTYGFTSDVLPDAPTARFVRINVIRAVLHNNPNNWYPPTLYEVKVFGRRARVNGA